MRSVPVSVECYLIVGTTVRGEGEGAWATGKPSVRVSKGRPKLAPDEIAIALKISIPVALFQRPALKVDLSIPAERVAELVAQREQPTYVNPADRDSGGA